MRKGQPDGPGDASSGKPAQRRPGEAVGAWDRAWSRKMEVERREEAALERELMAADEEPGNKEHEIIWVTRDLAVCPPCRRAYRKTKLAQGYSTARANELEDYFRSVGIFDKMAPILAKRQEERAEEQKRKDESKRGAGFKGKGHRNGRG